MPLLSWIEGHLSLLWLILAVVTIICLIWLGTVQLRMSRLLGRYRALMRGADGGSLEQALDGLLAQSQATTAQLGHLDDVSRQIEKAAKLSLQHLGVLRFDAFPDVGGLQSFALALVDGHGNGVVISSLASRQATRMYAKPLQRWETDYALTDEEKEAIALAYRQRL